MEVINNGYPYNAAAFRARFKAEWRARDNPFAPWHVDETKVGDSWETIQGRLAERNRLYFEAYRETIISVVQSLAGLEVKVGRL
jgi:hypothetical protein